MTAVVQGTPYVAEYQGKNRGFFFLNPKDAEKFRDRVKVSVGCRVERPLSVCVRSCKLRGARSLFGQPL